MRKINKIVLISLLASSSILANEISLETFGLNIGSSTMDYSQKNHQGSIVLGNEPDKTLTSYELFATLNPISDMCKEYNMKPYVSYTYSNVFLR